MSEDSPCAKDEAHHVLRRYGQYRDPHAAEDLGLMRIAVSNIAWTADEDEQVEHLLEGMGIDALEGAPTRLFPGHGVPTDAEVRSVARRLEHAGLELIAFQSLLYSTPEAALFGSSDRRRCFIDRIVEVIRLAERLRVGVLVLGSPRNRRIADGMSEDDAVAAAIPVFRTLGAIAEDSGTVLCIEPNPPSYGCDFITTPAEAAALVDAVGAPGFGMHLDTAGTVLAGADPVAAVDGLADRVRHVHVSAPDLAEIEEERVPHERIAEALRRAGYRGAASIEMRSGPIGTNAERVRLAVERTRRHYG